MSRNTSFRSVSSLLGEAQLSRHVSRMRVFLSSGPSRKRSFSKKKRQKCCSDESTCVVLLCCFFDFSSPFQNSSGKIGFLCRRGFSKLTFSLKIGFLPTRPFDNFAPGEKKETGRFSGDAFLRHRIRVFRFRRKKTDETTRNVVYSVSAPKPKFCRRLFQN